jgi:chain length determinant protein EpsF
MNLQLFLSALRARFGVFALILSITVLSAAVVSILLPKTYKATVSLLVDAKEEQSLGTVLRPLVAPHERMGFLQTQVDIVTSHKVARRAVQALKLAENPAIRETFQEETGGAGSIEDWLVEALLDRLKVETSQSSVIHLSFTWRDARFAAAVANAFAQAFVDTVLELRVEPQRQAAQWFDEQLKNLRENLESAQARLTDYHRRWGIVSAEERFDVENTRLDELSAQLVRVQDQTFELKSRERHAREYLERGRALEEQPQVLADAFIQRLKADLMHAEAKLREARTQYGANHPELRRLAAERESLKERLEAEAAKVVAAISGAVRQSLQREAEVRAAIAAQRQLVLGLKESRNELTVLARNVESAQRAYDTAMQRAVVTQVDSRANQANVAVLSAAAAPAKPHRPKVGLNIALSVAVGSMLGLAIVVLMEMADRRVRTLEDLGGDGGVPLLAVLGSDRRGQLRLLAPASPARVLPRAA